LILFSRCAAAAACQQEGRTKRYHPIFHKHLFFEETNEVANSLPEERYCSALNRTIWGFEKVIVVVYNNPSPASG